MAVRMSVNIYEKPPKSAQNSLKTFRLYTEPLRTHLFARPGLIIEDWRFANNPKQKQPQNARDNDQDLMWRAVAHKQRLPSL